MIIVVVNIYTPAFDLALEAGLLAAAGRPALRVPPSRQISRHQSRGTTCLTLLV